MMDTYTFGRYNKEEYKKYLFPDQKEYNRIEDIFLACKGILHTPLEYLHPKTIKFRDLYKREILDESWDLPGVREKYGRLLPMAQIQVNSDFQKKFHAHEDFLMSIIKQHNPYCYPAEEDISSSEICFVLYNHPEFVQYVQNQCRSMQEILVRKNKAQYLNQPPKVFVYNMNAAQVQSVPFNARDIDFEVLAVVHDKLSIEDIHHKQLPHFVESNMTTLLLNNEIKKLACEVEKLGVSVFGDNTMEKMRMSFLEQYDWQYNPHIDGFMCVSISKPLVAYMKNPSKKIKETSVRNNPYTVCGIKYQYDAIQELALRVMAAKREEYFQSNPSQSYFDNPWNFQVLRLMLSNPSSKIEKLYMDLVRKQR